MIETNTKSNVTSTLDLVEDRTVPCNETDLQKVRNHKEIWAMRRYLESYVWIVVSSTNPLMPEAPRSSQIDNINP